MQAAAAYHESVQLIRQSNVCVVAHTRIDLHGHQPEAPATHGSLVVLSIVVIGDHRGIAVGFDTRSRTRGRAGGSEGRGCKSASFCSSISTRCSIRTINRDGRRPNTNIATGTGSSSRTQQRAHQPLQHQCIGHHLRVAHRPQQRVHAIDAAAVRARGQQRGESAQTETQRTMRR